MLLRYENSMCEYEIKSRLLVMKEKLISSLGEYLADHKDIVIPYYQRGYIWGKSRGSEKDSVQFLLESINGHFNDKKIYSYKE